MDSYFYFFFAMDGRPEGRAKRSIIQFGHCTRFGSKWKSKLNDAAEMDERCVSDVLCLPHLLFLSVIGWIYLLLTKQLSADCQQSIGSVVQTPVPANVPRSLTLFMCFASCGIAFDGMGKSSRHSSLGAQLTIRTDVSQTHNRIRIVNGIM